MSSPATTLPRPASPWIFRPSIDLLVGCGAWSLPLLAITFYLSQRDAVAMSFAFYFLGIFCNQPHYMATVYRAYRTPYDFNRYRFFTVYVTVFILLTLVVVHLAPALFPWLLTFYLTWSPWHYSGQNFGISMMLARRAGARLVAGAAAALRFGALRFGGVVRAGGGAGAVRRFGAATAISRPPPGSGRRSSAPPAGARSGSAG